MRQCHRTSAHTLTFSFTYQLRKQKYLLKHVPPETRECFCGYLMHECRTARGRYMTPQMHIFFFPKQYSKKKLSVLGRDALTSSNSGQHNWLQLTSSFHILPSSSLLTILPSDDTLRVTSAQIFQRCRQPSQNSTRQMADMKLLPYQGPQKYQSPPEKKKFSRPVSVHPWTEQLTASLNKS